MAITSTSTSITTADSAVSSQSVVVNTGSGLASYAGGGGAGTVSGGLSGPVITSVAITDNSYNVIDDTAANNLGNSYIKITGTNFQSTANVYVAGTMIPSANVTFVSSAEIRVALPPNAVGATTLSVFNSNSSGAIYSSILNFSSFPTWVTSSALPNRSTGKTFGFNIVATGNSTITYANTTALPVGTTLASNGYFYGSLTVGTQTSYNFDVTAVDSENQNILQTFNITIVMLPVKELYAWGQNQFGGLGDNSRISKSSPVQVGTETTWSSLAASQYDVKAIKNDGTLWSWGYNTYGQLAQNNKINRSSPTQVGTLTNWSKVSAGNNNLFAIKNDGTLWALAGFNGSGDLGINISFGYRSSPVQIGTDTNWSYTGGNWAIKTNGTLWGWGSSGAFLGQNNTILRSAPVQVGVLTNWSSVAHDFSTTLAIKNDGTLWAWGLNDSGQLGVNDRVNRSSPVQVGISTDWALVKSSKVAMLAIKTNGTLWTWGNNVNGQLGLNDLTNRSSPTQIGSGTTWLSAAGGYYTRAATKTDGTLWLWGNNTYGSHGQNDKIARSSPVQVGTKMEWASSDIAVGYDNMLILTNN